MDADPDKQLMEFACLRARQPVGDLFIASISHKNLIRMTYFDVRRVLQSDRDFETYLGIQRPLEPRRVDDLGRYVNYVDASFPTSVIIAIDSEYASYDEAASKLTIRNYREGEGRPSAVLRNIARVLDGQHRIAGLREFDGDSFDLSVTIFVGADIADQAQIFSTVNLEQTKVRKSLVYDLFELARTRSPQKVCHNVAVILNGDADSALYRRIKRLGVATVTGRFEPITQSTFVESIMPYISLNPKEDRDILLRGGTVERYDDPADREKAVLRIHFVEGRDFDIAKVFFNYFRAVQERWSKAWSSQSKGMMLNRTNGIRALIRFFPVAYREVAAPGNVPSMEKFLDVFAGIPIPWNKFSTKYFAPGTSGEARLYRVLLGQEELTPLDPDDQTPDPSE
ncbi:MAG TPA: DGQHR domain-containing protein [Allosphingosinicella sp.]|nr:DGQHR domain-containing protein [Allosphingosinicella sp.]